MDEQIMQSRTIGTLTLLLRNNNAQRHHPKTYEDNVNRYSTLRKNMRRLQKEINSIESQDPDMLLPSKDQSTTILHTPEVRAPVFCSATPANLL